ncbi:hypothetical protein FQZ97_1004640 [compost metagenome]
MQILTRHIECNAFAQQIAGSIALGGFLGVSEQFVEVFRRVLGIKTSFFEKLLVVEQCQRAHSRRQAIIFIAALHCTDDREEFTFDLVVRKCVLRQRLQNATGCKFIEPAIEQLHDVRAFARHLRRNDAGLIVVIRERNLFYLDVRIGFFEILDQFVHRLDARFKDILPIFDFNGLCSVDCDRAQTGHKTRKQQFTHLH